MNYYFRLVTCMEHYVTSWQTENLITSTLWSDGVCQGHLSQPLLHSIIIIRCIFRSVISYLLVILISNILEHRGRPSLVHATTPILLSLTNRVFYLCVTYLYSQRHRLMYQRHFQAISCLCENACKISPAICHEERVLWSGNRLLPAST